MEAPDFDELEWMAHQEFLGQDLHPEPLSEEEFEHLPLSPSLPDILSAPPDVSERKRASSCDSGRESSHKRGRTDAIVQRNNLEEDSICIQNEAKAWSPPCSSNSNMETCDSFGDPNLKLPTRRLANINGDFMSITNPAGDRVYSKIVEIPNTARSMPHISSGQLRCGFLLLPYWLVDLSENKNKPSTEAKIENLEH